MTAKGIFLFKILDILVIVLLITALLPGSAIASPVTGAENAGEPNETPVVEVSPTPVSTADGSETPGAAGETPAAEAPNPAENGTALPTDTLQPAPSETPAETPATSGDITEQSETAEAGAVESATPEATPPVQEKLILSSAQLSKIHAEGGPDTLFQKANSNGHIPLIVGLNVAFVPMGKLDVTRANSQRNTIAQAQARVLGDLAGKDVRHVKQYEFIPYMAMDVDEAGLNALIASGNVTSIEIDTPLRATLDLSVPRIGAPSAWADGYTGSGWTVAILDTGVDKTHPFLSGRVVSEACYSHTYSSYYSTSICPGGVQSSTASGSAMPYAGVCPSGECDHGTHVAGIAAGYSTGLKGVAYAANIIAIQVFSRFDSEASEYCGAGNSPCALSWQSDQITALDRVYALRSTYNIAAANLSLGGGYYTGYCDSSNAAYKTAIDNLRSAGIATVISSGNEAHINGISSPACISTAISVGATDDSDHVAAYSNSASFLSLLAPGSDILSSVPGPAYQSWNGTSMAAPHVTGSFAILKQAAPSKTVDELLSALVNTGVPITDSRNGITKPRINVYNATRVPDPPTPVSPSGTITNNRVTYTWNAVSDAVGYNVYVEGPSGSVTNSFNTPAQVGCSSGTGTCSLYVDTVLTNASYTWSVRAQNNAGWGAFSSPTGFVVNYPVPVAPTPVSPSGTITSMNKVTYTWNAIGDAVGYNVYADGPSGLVFNSYNVPSQLGCSAGTGTCSLYVDSALEDAAYTWYVRAQNIAGWGPFSGGTAFTIHVKPNPPAPVSPSGTITSTNKMTYVWNAVSGVVGYNVYAEGPSGLVFNSYNVPSQLGCSTGTGTCSLYVDSALSNASYSWYVRAQNSYGWGAFSSATNFVIDLPVPAAPTPVSPSGAVTGTNIVTYIWNAISGAVGYNVYVDGPSGLVFNSYFVPSQVGCSAGTGNCSLYISTALNDAAYTWYVRAQNNAGWGPFSGGTAFTIQIKPAAPTPVSPSGTVSSTNKMTYVWNAVSGAIGYNVYVEGPSSSVVTNSYNIPSQLGCSSGTGNCSLYVDTSLANASYTWYVRAQNSAGWGAFSGATNFTVDLPVPAAPTPVSPSGTVTSTNKMTYTWNAISSAVGYNVYAEGPSGLLFNSYNVPSQLGCSTGTGTCSLYIDTALANASYSWYVRAQNNAGWGSFSSATNFVVALPVPAAPTPVSPSGAVTGMNKVTYVWNAISGAVGYNVYADGPSGNVFNSYNVPSQLGCSAGTGTCSLYVNTALNDAAYTWYVRAQNNAGWGAFSSGTAFTIQAKPSAPTPVSPSGTITSTNKMTYVWNAVSGATTTYNVYVEGPSGSVVTNSNVTPSQVGCSSGTGNCSFYVDSALANASYTWSVRAQNSYGWGAFSSATGFVLNLPVPAAPTPVSPSGTVTSTNKMTYTWNAMSGAVGYNVYAEGPSGLVFNSYNIPSQLGCSSGTGTCSLYVDTALANASYDWYVRAQNSVGWGAFSSATNFVINLAVPAAPVPVSPSGTITSTNKVTYIWNAMSGAVGYNVYAEGPSGMVFNSYNIPSQLGCSAGTGNCSLAVDSALDDAAYTWYVRAQNSVGWGAFSSGTAFTIHVKPSAPTPVSPSGTITSTNKMTYVWNAVSGAIGYHVYAEGPSGSVAVSSYNIPSQLGCSSGTGNCSLYVDSALANASYSWYVRAQNSYGWGAFSGGTNFVLNLPLPPAPTPVSPSGTVTTTNKMTYVWNAVSGAVGYNVYAEGPSGLVFNTYNIPSQVGCSAGTGTCSIYISTALANAAYTWYVRAQNSADWGPFSSGLGFTVAY